jgi:hypothetical protein
LDRRVLPDLKANRVYRVLKDWPAQLALRVLRAKLGIQVQKATLELKAAKAIPEQPEPKG